MVLGPFCLRDVDSICILVNELHFCKFSEHLTQKKSEYPCLRVILKKTGPQECWGGLATRFASKPQSVEKGWHLHDYVSPAVLLIPVPHGCKMLLPPSSGEFNHLVCAPTVIKNVPFKLGSGWRYLKTGRQAEAKAVGYGRLLKVRRWDRLIALRRGVNNVSGFVRWSWFFERLKCMFLHMYRHRCAPSHWCTHCTHEAAFWGCWDLGTHFSSKSSVKKLHWQIAAADSIWQFRQGWISGQAGGNGKCRVIN